MHILISCYLIHLKGMSYLSRIKSSGIAQYFEDIFISEDIGYNKPDKSFFDKCFETIKNADRAETVIVGDSLSSDILGGINAGIRTIWYNPLHEKPSRSVCADFETDDLCEIPNILANM